MTSAQPEMLPLCSLRLVGYMSVWKRDARDKLKQVPSGQLLQAIPKVYVNQPTIANIGDNQNNSKPPTREINIDMCVLRCQEDRTSSCADPRQRSSAMSIIGWFNGGKRTPPWEDPPIRRVILLRTGCRSADISDEQGRIWQWWTVIQHPTINDRHHRCST